MNNDDACRRGRILSELEQTTSATDEVLERSIAARERARNAVLRAHRVQMRSLDALLVAQNAWRRRRSKRPL